MKLEIIFSFLSKLLDFIMATDWRRRRRIKKTSDKIRKQREDKRRKENDPSDMQNNSVGYDDDKE